MRARLVFVRAENTDPAKKKTKSLCYFVTEKSDLPLGFPKLDQKLVSVTKDAVKETKAKLGAISIIHTRYDSCAENSNCWPWP